MSFRYLNEAQVTSLIEMPTALEALERAFAEWGQGHAQNTPRVRMKDAGVMLHSLLASANYLGVMGWKIYTTTKQAARFHVALYDLESGAMRCLLQADKLGQVRTGAASGVATKHLARRDASIVGLFGTGWQAESQLEAVCAVRQIKSVRLFGRNAERRNAFVTRMEQRLGIHIEPVDNPEEVVLGADILITATTAREPLFDGALVEPGTHINAIGSNFLKKAEVDAHTITRCNLVVCDSIEQCQLEAGDLAIPIQNGEFSWEQCVNLADVLNEAEMGRQTEDDITLFKSVGLGLEDVAVGYEVLKRAEADQIGTLVE